LKARFYLHFFPTQIPSLPEKDLSQLASKKYYSMPKSQFRLELGK
jgi:hypothetical protein